MPADQSRGNPGGPVHAADAAERLGTRILLGAPVLLLLFIGETLSQVGRRAGSFVAFLIYVPGNLLVVWLISSLILKFAKASGVAFSNTVLAGGSHTPDEAFSREESWILQGHIEQAEGSYRARWEASSPSVEAGRRLGDLLDKQGRSDEALAIFEALRRLELPPTLALSVANRIIDLHQKAGRIDRLKVELSRFATAYRGTGAGEHAARRLRELKDQDRKDEPEGDD